MSLDVDLIGPEEEKECTCCECGNRHTHKFKPTLFDANITHNLGEMAEAAGIYKALWRPEELGITKASQLIVPLVEGLGKLKACPDEFKKFNAPNGWGKYEDLIRFVNIYIDACAEHPDADISVSR